MALFAGLANGHSAARDVLTVAVFGVLVVGWGASRRVKENVHELRAQNLELHRLGEDLSSMNASLEAKVAERSASLEARERSGVACGARKARLGP